jgi:succinyl-CoA synthetase beta subunit
MVRLVEYQGKSLLKATGLPVPNGEVASTPQEAKGIAERIGKPVVVKAQIVTKGRFKAGGIRFANTPAEAFESAEQILGRNIKGLNVSKVLVEEKLTVDKEFYAGIIVDDSYKAKGPLLMVSSQGGVDVELVPDDRLARIRVDILRELSVHDVADAIQQLGIAPDSAGELSKLAHGVYRVFRKYDARSVETNPIVLTSNGMTYAADCRIVLDEASVSRHPEVGIDFPRDIGRPPTELERIAWKIEENDFRGIGYFVQMSTEIKPEESFVGFHGIGGGGAMIGADALIRHGLRIANYADTSGNPTASKIYRVIKVIFSQPNIVGYALMGPVIANQEQWHHAHAIVRALREELVNRPNFPVVILIAGNKEAESIEILKHGLAGLPAQIEVYGREYAYNVDYVAQRMKTLVDDYRMSQNASQRR